MCMPLMQLGRCDHDTTTSNTDSFKSLRVRAYELCITCRIQYSQQQLELTRIRQYSSRYSSTTTSQLLEQLLQLEQPAIYRITIIFHKRFRTGVFHVSLPLLQTCIMQCSIIMTKASLYYYYFQVLRLSSYYSPTRMWLQWLRSYLHWPLLASQPRVLIASQYCSTYVLSSLFRILCCTVLLLVVLYLLCTGCTRSI